VKRLLPLLAAALWLSACGSSSPESYTKTATAKCLTGQGVRTKPVPQSVDFVAWSAEGGSFRATLTDNFVTVSFGPTVDKANGIADAYRRFAATNVGVSDVLRQQGNAVMLWHVHPSDTDISVVTGCLKGK
jgi:hypothetical protein